MKSLALSFILLVALNSSAHSEENCAIAKKDQYDILLEKLKDLDYDLATQARTAYGIVSNYETFGHSSERCVHMDELLANMERTVEIYTAK